MSLQVPEPERPQMPDSFGFGLEQYPFTPLDWNDVARKVSEARNYWIVTATPSGKPHSVPVWGIWADDGFWFLTDPKSVTARNLQRNPQAVVNLESGDDVVILEGEFELINPTAESTGAFAEKYDMPWGAEQIPVFRLRLRKALAWTEADFPSNASRWRF